MQLNMYPKKDFKPVHNKNYVMFVVDDWNGSLEFKYYRCELHYTMMDAENNGAPLPSTVCYNGQDELPFDVPLLWDKELKKMVILTPEQVKMRAEHKDPEQRYWLEKSWMLCGRSSMDQIQPEEFDQLSLGIAAQSDFMAAIREANKEREKNENKHIHSYNVGI